jgi:transketolase
MALANKHRPSALLLSRQNLPYAPKADADVITQGAYVLAEPAEVGLKKKAGGRDHRHRLGSAAGAARAGRTGQAEDRRCAWSAMPSTTVFDRQDDGVQEGRAAVQAAAHCGGSRCHRLLVEVRLRRRDRHRQLRRVAPAGVLFKHFGFTTENVVATVRKVLSKKK